MKIKMSSSFQPKKKNVIVFDKNHTLTVVNHSLIFQVVLLELNHLAGFALNFFKDRVNKIYL